MAPALVLVDIQNDYFPGGRMELVGSEAAAENAARALALFRERGWPLFHVQHVFESPDAPFFVAGTPGVETHAAVRPIEGEQRIVKHTPSSFNQTDLHARLQALRVNQLVIAGMMSHMCIDATTRAARDLGYEITLLGDACATRDLEIAGEQVKARDAHNAFMAALNWYYARVLPTAEAIKHFK